MQLGWVEELGSGVLNVNKYWQAYSNGDKPQFIEGASFKILLPVSGNFFTGNEDGNEDCNEDNQDSNYAGLSEAVNDQIDGGVNGGVRKEIIGMVAIIMSNEGLKARGIAAKRSK